MTQWIHVLRRKLFFRPVHEALVAYVQRLPDNIQVDWIRDGKFIIGDVHAGDYRFKTQAHSAAEFVKMVNSAILAVHEIPPDYSDVVGRYKLYAPKKEEFENLNNAAIKKSSFSTVRNEKEVLAGA